MFKNETSNAINKTKPALILGHSLLWKLFALADDTLDQIQG